MNLHSSDNHSLTKLEKNEEINNDASLEESFSSNKRAKRSFNEMFTKETNITSNMITIDVNELYEKYLFWKVGSDVKELVDLKVKEYTESNEFKQHIEDYKIKLRKKMYDEIDVEIQLEKEKLLIEERKLLKQQIDQAIQEEQIAIENKLKIEEYERQQYILKRQEDEEKLQRLRIKAEQEKIARELEAQRRELERQAYLQEQQAQAANKISFSLNKKKNSLF